MLAKHSKSFSFIDYISVGVSRMQRNFEPTMREVADNVTALHIPATAHWIPEEDPKALTTAPVKFARS